MCGSTCFGRLRAHNQEHTTVLGFPGFSVVGRGLADLADHDQKRSSRFSPTVKPETPSAVLCS
jgi:hypothetical protein